MKTRSSEGFTLIELMFVVGVIGVLSAVAAPTLSRTRLVANEASAVGSLRTIQSAQMAYSVGCGGGFYSPSLATLALPVGTSPGYLGPEFAGEGPVSRSGYDLDLTSGQAPVSGVADCHDGDVVGAYHMTADPQAGRGIRYFGGNASGGIFESLEFADMPDTGVPPAPWLALQK